MSVETDISARDLNYRRSQFGGAISALKQLYKRLIWPLNATFSLPFCAVCVCVREIRNYLPNRAQEYSTEPGTGRTRRKSLRTQSLDEAIVILVARVREKGLKTKSSSLSLVLHTYLSEHAENLPSKVVARSHVRKLLAVIGASTPVETINEVKQREFVERCLEEGNKLAYAARIMTTLSAALAYSKIHDPEIIYTESAMVRHWKFSSSPRRKAHVPSDDECAELVTSGISTSLLRWLIIQMLTGGRPQTAVDLQPAAFNRESGIVDLNGAERSQNKKYRAKVKAGRVLRFLLRRWERSGLEDMAGRYCGYSIEGVKSAVQRLARDTGIPVSMYSCRQKVTTVLRKARVPEDQISELLGHKRPNLRTTAGYGEWDPDYQREAAAALDSWFWRIRKLAKAIVAKRALNSQGTPEEIHRPQRRVR